MSSEIGHQSIQIENGPISGLLSDKWTLWLQI